MKSEVYNIDCLEYMRTLPDKAFQLAIADPPYGLQPKGEAQNCLLRFGQLDTVNYLRPEQEFFDELKRVSKHCIVFGYNHLVEFLGPCKEFIFWYKHNPLHTFSDGELAYTNFERIAKCFDYHYYSTINQDEERVHPTQKPIALYVWLMKNYAKEGDTIFDPMMGSQSSRIAANRLGFDYVGCEIDKEYFDRGCERFHRECHGIQTLKDGRKVEQLSLFT